MAQSSKGKHVIPHLETTLFVSWLVFVYRDVWPLATYTQEPEDAAEGWLIWTHIGLLTLSAILVPGFSPRQYRPVDPEVRLQSGHSEAYYKLCHRISESQVMDRRPHGFLS